MRKTNFLLTIVFAIAVLFTSCSEDIMGPETDGLVPDATLKSLTVDGIVAFDVNGVTMDDANLCGQENYTLWAGQHIDAGTVLVSNDETNLYVTVTSTEGFQNVDENLKIWLGTDFDKLPATKDGTPKIGKFPYKVTLDGEYVYTLNVLLEDVPGYGATICGEQSIFVVVHGDVLAPDGNGGTTAETAFGGDLTTEDSRWMYYIDYIPACCGDNPPPVVDYFLETAFAYGTHVFAIELNGKRAGSNNPDDLEYLGLTRNRWGWAILFQPKDFKTTPDLSELEIPIYAGAGLNHLENGIEVGTALITYNSQSHSLDITYNLYDGYVIEEVHVYASDLEPEIIAPGQYGYTEYFDPMVNTTSHTFNVIDTYADGIWLILHAVVAI